MATTQTVQQQVYVTLSGMVPLPNFQFVYQLMEAERTLFSVDYPWQTLDEVAAVIRSLPISEPEKEAIAFRNAESQLGLPV